MRGRFNDFIRALIALGIKLLGVCFLFLQRVKLSTFSLNQRHLRRKYRIDDDTPILSFGTELEALIDRAASRAGPTARFATTSGSTAKPKRVLFTKSRLRNVKLNYIDMFAQCCLSLKLGRTSLYVFSSFNVDDSLTALLLQESNWPNYFSRLQAPYRVQSHRAIRALVSIYGATAVRLWILTIANPGVLYCTNPSTLVNFLDELKSDWKRSAGLINEWTRNRSAFNPALLTIARQLESTRSDSRLRTVAASNEPLPLEACAPAVNTYICWTGGYVSPFLERLSRYLPSQRYRLVPMYSMSTETIETSSYFSRGSVHFLPLASGVLYEFIEDGAAYNAANLLDATQLKAGKKYTMVASDPFGLRRYQTGDLFLCRSIVGALPDLMFVGRRGLEYSFTGEKLTAEHVSLAFQSLRNEYPMLGADKFLTCLPCQPDFAIKPHYKIVLVDQPSEVDIPSYEVARRCDQLLQEINCEYRNKRESGRLGPVKFARVSLRDFIARIAHSEEQQTWEAQFKLLPLYKREWVSD